MNILLLRIPSLNEPHLLQYRNCRRKQLTLCLVTALLSWLLMRLGYPLGFLIGIIYPLRTDPPYT